MAGFLPCSPDPAFCVVHRPSGVPSGQGIVFCPPLAWSEFCTHRARWDWAQALAAAGHHALRLDLPGSGDSVGSPLEPGRPAAWIDAIATAARWLLDEAACTRIVALGIGFGGMLAWLAAAAEPAIDDLILWGTPTSGRRVVRELQSAVKLNVDWELAPGLSEESVAPTSIDDAGAPMTPATFEELSRLELDGSALGHARERRVLLLARPGDPVDASLHELLVSSGVTPSVADGSELGAIMQYESNVQPRSAIESSLSWLESAETGLSSPGGDTGRRLPESVEFERDGVRVRERMLTLSLSTGEAQAIVTEPLTAPPAGLTAVFVSASADRRIGPNRLWVQTARRWAARGLSAVRVDPPGVGEAPGENFTATLPWELLRDDRVGEQREILRAVRAAGLPGRTILVAFCSGSFRAFGAARDDEDTAGIFLIGLPALRTKAQRTLRREYAISRLALEQRGQAHMGRVAARLRLRALRLWRSAECAAITLTQSRRDRLERSLGQLTTRGTELLVILRSWDWTAQQLRPLRRQARLRRDPRLRIAMMPSDDTRFRPPPAQAWTARELDDALERVIASDRAPSPAAARPDALDHEARKNERGSFVP